MAETCNLQCLHLSYAVLFGLAVQTSGAQLVKLKKQPLVLEPVSPLQERTGDVILRHARKQGFTCCMQETNTTVSRI